jgi:hypothetical protein
MLRTSLKIHFHNPITVSYAIFIVKMGPSWSWSYGSWIYNYLCNQCLSPLMLWVRISIRERCKTFCDKVCQWLATGQWFSPGLAVSSTNKTDRHDRTVILLKVVLNTIKHQTIFTMCVSRELLYKNFVASGFPGNQQNTLKFIILI